MSETAQSGLCAKKLKLHRSSSTNLTSEKTILPVRLAKKAENCLSTAATEEASRVWSSEERKKFYNGLRLFGTDFSMISAVVLVNRSQKEIYRRFRREDKLMPDLVTRALQWNSDHKLKIAKGFSRVLEQLKIDLPNFDPLNPPKQIREDGIKPLEYYLLSPSFN